MDCGYLRKLLALAPQKCLLEDKTRDGTKTKLQVIIMLLEKKKSSCMGQNVIKHCIPNEFIFIRKQFSSGFHCIRYNNSLMLSISDQIAIYLFIYISHTYYCLSCISHRIIQNVILRKRVLEEDTISNGTLYVCKILFQRFLALLHTMQYRINSNHT